MRMIGFHTCPRSLGKEQKGLQGKVDHGEIPGPVMLRPEHEHCSCYPVIINVTGKDDNTGYLILELNSHGRKHELWSWPRV